MALGDGTSKFNKLRRGSIAGTQPGMREAKHTDRVFTKKERAKLRELGIDPKSLTRKASEPPAITEWDNPALKPTRAEQRQRWRDREALIQMRSDPQQPVVRSEIIARDKATCWICQTVLTERTIHLDHVIPLSRGGKHTPSNLKVACKSCNEWKGDRIVTLVHEDQS